MVADLTTGTPGSSPSSMVDVNGTMFFIADDGAHGRELWKSDGSAHGTKMVKDINPGLGGSNISSPTAVGSTLYFAAFDGAHGSELWKSDGSALGTVRVSQLQAGAANGLDSSADNNYEGDSSTVTFTWNAA